MIVETAADPISFERKIGATQATTVLANGYTVTGDWAAGDCQALRRLVEALTHVAESAQARLDAAHRHVVDQRDGLRRLRGQLDVAQATALAPLLQRALDVTGAAEQAFEEAKWKEGNRYLALANTLIALHNAAITFSPPGQ